MDTTKLLKSLNDGINETGKLMNSLLTPEMQKNMTDEQKIQVSNMKKEIGIITSSDLERKKELIKKYL